MKPKVTVYIATSLDGYIARKDGNLDWLDTATENAPESEDFGYKSLMQTVDTLVLGRMTYEKVLSFGEWPYGDLPVIVLSSKPIAFPDHFPKTIRHSSEHPRELCERLSQEGVQHIYIDGGKTIQHFLNAGLVDEITLSIMPVILGEGIPLFGPVESDIQLHCLEATTHECGVVQIRYSVSN